MIEVKNQINEPAPVKKDETGRFPIQLTGPYWGNAQKAGSPNTAAVGSADLTAELAVPDGAAPYRIYRKDTAIGFTVKENFTRG